jgi:ribosomal-protein-alanine N-acetyltransferase
MQILGYLFTRKYIDFVEIERIGVLSNKRRNHVGEELIKKLEGIVTLEGIKKITLEVREDNHSAISLYKKLGFNKDSIRKDYYQDKENAILMSKILG